MASPTMTAFLEAMTGGPAAQESFRQALAQDDDPRVRMIAEWAARLQDQRNDEGPVIDTTAVEEPVAAADWNKERRRLLRRVRGLTEELRFQRGIGDTLALALGACYLCWGDDPECERCRRHGKPGWQGPNQNLFNEYIAPAVRRMERERNPSVASRNRDWQPSHPDEATERSSS